MSQPPQGAGYFRAPKKLESKDEVIARVCAFLAEELGKKRVDTRTPEQIQQAEDAYWEEKGLRRYESQLWYSNLRASFFPIFEPCGPVRHTRTSDQFTNYTGRFGHVRSD